MVERSTGRKLKALRTDNGGEYTSREFETYLKTEGIRNELTVPKNPEQNGVAERMNRTLIEYVRSMLADSKLPQKCWAEALSTAVYIFVIGSEKTTAMAQNKKNEYFYIGLELQVCSLFCRLFQAHSVFRCVVMGANTKRCSRTHNEIIASKREFPVKTFNIRILT